MEEEFEEKEVTYVIVVMVRCFIEMRKVHCLKAFDVYGGAQRHT